MNNQNNNALPHVVIIGGGFGGLAAARALKRAPVRVTLVDRTNHHLFQPLLYQVAMAGLSPADIAEPIRTILRKQKNVTVLLAEAVGVNFEQRVVQLADGNLSYDYLILATGGRTSYFGHEVTRIGLHAIRHTAAQHARGHAGVDQVACDIRFEQHA